ncbi:MAG: phenylacetate--CoA ligase family protein [Chloroflexi bacterium]|nr:phenylacetate--CoA ligase family protein [Chloroflexota bacterium]
MGMAPAQLTKLNHLLSEVWERNPFYTQKWKQAGVTPLPLGSMEDLARFPLTTREELVADQTAHPPLGTNLTYPLSACKRFHRSSGTTRAPVFWADHESGWQWVLHCSRALYLLAGVAPRDRLFFAMRFGPSSGPWIIYEGACDLGCACLTSGSSDPEEQWAWVQKFQPDVLVGKPSQLIALGEWAGRSTTTPPHLAVRKIISTGEPGAHLPSVRSQLERLWQADCFDRYGLTEAGSVAGECAAHSGGLHLLEEEFIAEVISPGDARPVPEGEWGELVLTNLGRLGRPIIRYRTGDLVRLLRDRRCPCGRTGAVLMGGIRRNVAKEGSAGVAPAVFGVPPKTLRRRN